MVETQHPTDITVLGFLASRLSAPEQLKYRQFLEFPIAADEILQKKALDSVEGSLLGVLNSKSLRNEAYDLLKSWKRQGITSIGYGESPYPESLTKMSRPPLVLFFKGRLPETSNWPLSLSIVGMRKADSCGLEISHDFAKACALQGVTIVSGLAMGVDAAAHTGALETENDFPTVAVLGSGLDQEYPAVNAHLYRRIVARGGLLISQFEIGEKAYPANFLNRNRIIAALSQATLVIQAGKRSGSLATARCAMEEGRDVMAIPGSIRDIRHEGTNQIISDGAYLVQSPEEVCEILGVKISRGESGNRNPYAGLSPIQFSIVQRLSQVESIHYDELASSFSDRGVFAHEILNLELLDLLRRRPGNFIALSNRSL